MSNETIQKHANLFFFFFNLIALGVFEGTYHIFPLDFLFIYPSELTENTVP